MNYIYQERLPMVRIFPIMTIGVIVLLMYSLYRGWANNEANVSAAVMMIAVIICLSVVLINFYYLKINVSPEQLIFGFGWFKKKIYIKNLSALKIDRYVFKNYWGYGIRFGLDKTVGFAACNGHGVKFTERTTHKSYFVTSANPEQLYNILKQHGAQV